MAKVFIGMPVYNNSRFLREAVDSLRNQSFRDWILFFSDDASTDNTAQICEEYAQMDKRIVFYRQPKNLGLFENFEFTLNQSRCEYFMWAAGDDVWDKDFLKICLDKLENDKSLGLAAPCNTTIDSFGRTLLESPQMTRWNGHPSFRQVSKYIMEPEAYGKCNLMYGLFRTEVLKKIWEAYPQRKVWGQDYMFSLAAVARYGIYVDKRFLFKKRLGGYSSQSLAVQDPNIPPQKISLANARNEIFPYGRFGIYLSGHLEALRGTKYRLLAYLLYIRLPRAFWIHLKQRNFRKFIHAKFDRPQCR